MIYLKLYLGLIDEITFSIKALIKLSLGVPFTGETSLSRSL